MLREPVRLAIKSSSFPTERWEVAGWLSVPPDASDTLLILVHGASSTHAAWDMPYEPETYSLVQWAYERGMPTLNIDRLGAGESSHPPGKNLRIELHAESLNQIVQKAKGDGIAGHRFSRCVLIGHSYGALSCAFTQATYGSDDAVVLQGSVGMNVGNHKDTPESTAVFRERMLETLNGQPHFADRMNLYDADYFTISALIRRTVFYWEPMADDKLIAFDETLKGTMATGENETKCIGADSIAQVEVPLLVQVGQYDGCYYNAAKEQDIGRSYAAAVSAAPPNFTFHWIEGTGHNLTQHRNAHETYQAMADWLKATLPD